MPPPSDWSDDSFIPGGIYLALWHVALPHTAKPLREWGFVLAPRADGAGALCTRLVHTRTGFVRDARPHDAGPGRALRYFLLGRLDAARLRAVQGLVRDAPGPAGDDAHGFDWVLGVLGKLHVGGLVALRSMNALADELRASVEMLEVGVQRVGACAWLEGCEYKW